MSPTTKRIVVTDGTGFLGSCVVCVLERHGWRDIVAPKSRDYDLRKLDDTERLFEDLCPDVVIHLAGAVGGIGANRERPRNFSTIT
jgi:GDP-L-fucose synthase